MNFRKIVFLFLVSFYIFSVSGQTIRKNYLEMTPQEQTDYKSALQLLWNAGSTAVGYHMYFANAHNSHFGTNIHSFGGDGANFTAWHRFYLLHWELSLQKTSASYAYLTLPYWDWTSDPNRTLSSVTSTNSPNFVLFSLLKLSNFPSWGLTRGSILSGATDRLPKDAAISTLMANTTFFATSQADFSHNLEQNHNGPHVWVSGTMASGFSPQDPVFYLHHCNIDKLWQDWEDKNAGTQSTFAANAKPVPHYNTSEGWMDNIDPTTAVDARSIPFRISSSTTTKNYEVRYAEKGTVLIDGSNNTDFTVQSGESKLYRYGAWNLTLSQLEGTIVVGDVQRSGTTVISDKKGGFVAASGSTVEFRAGKEISFKPGTNLKQGSTVNAKIVYP